MDDGARQRLERAMLHMARLAAPTLPPADNAIITELKRQGAIWPSPAGLDREQSRSNWSKAAA